MTEKCPTCGAVVRVVTSNDGTSHYEPATVKTEIEKLQLIADGDMDWALYPDEAQKILDALASPAAA
jgi:hypothetical protein